MSRFEQVALLGCLAGCLTGCTEARTQVMVVIDADDAVQAQTETLEITVYSGAADSDTLVEVDAFDVDSPAGGFPYRLPIVPQDNDASRVFEVEVIAVDASGADIVTVRRETGFVAGRTLMLPIFLEASCLGVECDDFETCEGGSCEDPVVAASSLTEYVPPSGNDAGPGPGDDAGPGPGDDAGPGTDAGPPGDAGPGTDGGFDAGTDGGPGQVCGDSMATGSEVCDDGVNDGSYDGCASDCMSLGPHCGDGTVDSAMEECDDAGDVRCDASTCRWVLPACDDGIAALGELCVDPTSLSMLPLPGTGTSTVYELAGGDIDGDGDIDLAGAVLNSNRFIYLNDGSGALSSLGTFGGPDADEVTIADLDMDGTDEVIWAGLKDSMACASGQCLQIGSVRSGVYSATFSDSLPISGSGYPLAIHTGFADSDARRDIAIGFTDGRYVTYLGNATSVVGVPIVADPGGSAVRDILLPVSPTAPRDILFLYGSTAEIVSWPLDATGSLGTSTNWTSRLTTGSLSNSRGFMTYGDTGGGDRLISLGGQPHVQIRDIGTGLVETSVDLGWPLNVAVGGLATADLNADGRLDVVGTSIGTRELTIAVDNGTGGFTPTSFSTPCPVFVVILEDFNGDSAPDIALGADCGLFVLLANP